MHNLHLKDAMSHRLDYFHEDYTPINATANSTLKELAIEKQLFNGNIASMTNDLLPFDALNRQYLYDQLNRIVQADYAWVDSVGGFKILYKKVFQIQKFWIFVFKIYLPPKYAFYTIKISEILLAFKIIPIAVVL